jgi:hypothetical protein
MRARDGDGAPTPEAEGADFLEDVERLRRATVVLRRGPTAERRVAVLTVVRTLEAERAELVARRSPAIPSSRTWPRS